MAKRHAEDILIPGPSSKRYRGLCSVDLRMESKAPPAALSPPSLLELLGSRCRKRHFHWDQTDETGLDLPLLPKNNHGGLLKHVNTVQQTSGNLPERRINAVAKPSNKRTREDREGSTSSATSAADTTNLTFKVKVDAETTDPNEDHSFNSFHFWRTPLPEVDMSLLQDTPQKDSDAMET